MRKYIVLIGLMLLPIVGQATSKGMLFFYRSGRWIDNYLLHHIDTSYIGLPDYGWRVAFTSGMVGNKTELHSNTVYEQINLSQEISMYNTTTPSVDLGFNAGFRGLGFGYSWDALHAYAQKLNLSLGSKYIGVDFSYQKSRNIHTRTEVNGTPLPFLDNENNVYIRNTNLSIWYALNAAHYSHSAAMKQSYIQRKSAGSLLLHLSYMSSQIALGDTIMIHGAERPTLQSMMSGIRSMTTRQVALGIGYGINYTPNQGKVLLHASASAMLVCYSVNHVAYMFDDSIQSHLPGEALFTLRSAQPVHVTGNVRAGVSWEINKWVHLSGWATGENIRFKSEKTVNNNVLTLSNWNWKVQLNIGVRFGAGRDRIQRALGNPEINSSHADHGRFPIWLTDYFWSPK